MFSKTLTRLVTPLIFLLFASACGSSSDEPASSSATFSIEQISELICDSAPERMGSEAETFTKTSWMCTFEDDQVRIDEYEDQDQLEEARAMVLSIYTSADPTASLADYPFVCGDLWVAGFDYNETRDVAIELLTAAGVIAGTC